MARVKRKIKEDGMYTSSSYKKRKPYSRSRYTALASNNLGRITGKIAQPSTTLSRAGGPFSGRKYVTFLYENALAQIAGAANVVTAIMKPNVAFDFDSSGDFGNKQPLFYDTLLTASGPYRTYKVISWKTTYTFINNTATTPVDIFVSPPVADTSEIDSLTEMDNFPGVKRLKLTASTGSKATGTITVYGHIGDVFPSSALSDVNFVAPWNGSPTSICYQVCLARGSDGSTAPSVYVSVKHEAYTELSYLDALVS